ncbi:MAG: 50S ribosomal protein L3 [Ruminococcaceae bacterium]|nr:50S ribosomal protein L3 [Oscillospiraceae bacterium]
MKKAIIGKKLGMTQIFAENGAVVPVTVIQAGPCQVCQVKTVAKDGYSAVQLGFGEVAERKVTNPLKGHFKAANVSNRKHLKEFRLENAESMNAGDTVAVDTFTVGESVDVTGISKGHGYSGVIKRWGHHRLRMTHGTGPVHREVGSVGANSSPSRIFKNLKMAGQYGNVQVTVQNLEIVKIDTEKNLIAVKGAVPGARNGIVFIKDSVKA